MVQLGSDSRGLPLCEALWAVDPEGTKVGGNCRQVRSVGGHEGDDRQLGGHPYPETLSVLVRDLGIPSAAFASTS